MARARPLTTASVAALALIGSGPVRAAAVDLLAKGFADPPASARPRVFWHWMNGDISEAGIDLDLAWMRRAGIGGAHIVEVDLSTPQVVPHRLVFGSLGWRAAVKHAAETARRMNIDLGVVTSPGWSSTGGPWVEPAEAMKKLVWSHLEIDGDKPPKKLVLPPLPNVAGPFQNVPLADAPPQARAPFSVDVAVVAYRQPAEADDGADPVQVTSSAGPIDATRLADGDIARTQTLTLSNETRTAWIRLEYAKPRLVRAMTLGLPGARGFGAPAPPAAWLEASDDGQTFRRVAEAPAGMAQQRTVDFPPVRAKIFRVVFELPAPRPPPPGAPGAVPMTLGLEPTSVAVSELVLHSDARVNHAEEKAGFATAMDYALLATPDAPLNAVVPRADVLDLTGRMQADGVLRWRPPPGRWSVLRLGYSLTGHPNGPAEPEATGLEADKFNAHAVTDHLNTFLGRYETALGRPLRSAGVDMLFADSVEAGPQNWTADMLAQFRRRRGYDATPWLPALTGTVIEDPAAADRFLWDFRRTLAELYVDGQSVAVADAAHARKLTFYSEALEDHRPQLGDDMAMRRLADLPMGAMWTFPPGGTPQPTYVADLQGAASVAHVYGQNLVAAESMTAFGSPWAFSPRLLKPIADRELLLGVNQFVIHSSVHQPLIAAAPGLTLAIQLGQDFNRNETWADMARPWIDYLARSAFLMQQGRSVADVAYVYGEDAPLTALYGDQPVKDAPTGYGFDFIDADAILNNLSVRQGRLETTGGASYRLLYLGGDSRRMTLAVLRRIETLVRDGAYVVGPKPDISPSLADDPTAFAVLASTLWRGADQAGGHKLGDGCVLSGLTVDQALAALGVQPDVSFDVGGVQAAHRRLKHGDLYYVVNTTGAAIKTDGAFRVIGRAPELWRAETVEHAPLSYRQEGAITHVPLTLQPFDAAFVVFRTPVRAAERTVLEPRQTPLADLRGPWRVRFQADRGAPGAVTVSRLKPWNTSETLGVRYFSGQAEYETHFTFLAAPRGRVRLDLGDVREVAGVTLNGRHVGTAWTAPFQVDVTPFLRRGDNDLRINVANLWVNRLIGDAQPGAVHVADVTSPPYRADAPLTPSGLLGPVRLLSLSAP